MEARDVNNGPEPTTEREYLIQIYQQIKTVCNLVEKHDDRICALETAHQEELAWRNKLIGIGIAASLLLPIATAVLIRLIN